MALIIYVERDSTSGGVIIYVERDSTSGGVIIYVETQLVVE